MQWMTNFAELSNKRLVVTFQFLELSCSSSRMHNFNFSTYRIHEFVRLKSWIREVEIVNSRSWNREFRMMKTWIHEVKIMNSRRWNRVFKKLKCLRQYFVFYYVTNAVQAFCIFWHLFGNSFELKEQFGMCKLLICSPVTFLLCNTFSKFSRKLALIWKHAVLKGYVINGITNKYN
jgi:hypothetical protein